MRAGGRLFGGCYPVWKVLPGSSHKPPKRGLSFYRANFVFGTIPEKRNNEIWRRANPAGNHICNLDLGTT
jgi:hypothetical protein